ncbi:MAG: LexA family transcriptional regulator [Phycisphaerae bacterium]|nr:LexA family transcriptional regulator [Phycisphaerae bacterium]
MSLGVIIRKKREQLKFTLDEVSSRVGFSKPYLSTIETGKVKNPPSDTLLIKLEKLLGFEQGLLLHIAHMERVPSDIKQSYESTEAENKKWRSFMKQLIETKSDTDDLTNLLSEQGLQTDVCETDISSCKLVPIINKVSAGYPADFDDLDYPVGIADDYVRCPDLHDPNAFAVRVVGDSMQPKFSQGDIVVFSPALEVRNGDDCFVRFGMPHETTFKRIFFEADNTIRLQPRNEQYSPILTNGERVNGIYRALMRIEKL